MIPEPPFTVRDAYNHIFKREYDFAISWKYSIDKANRFANHMAIKYTWKEFHYLKKVQKYVKSLY